MVEEDPEYVEWFLQSCSPPKGEQQRGFYKFLEERLGGAAPAPQKEDPLKRIEGKLDALLAAVEALTERVQEVEQTLVWYRSEITR